MRRVDPMTPTPPMGPGAAGPYPGPYPADQYPAGAYPAGPPAGGGYPGAGQPGPGYAGQAGPGYTDQPYVDGNGYAAGQYADGTYPDGRYAGGPQTQEPYPEPGGAYAESSYAEGRYPEAPYADERYPGGYPAGPGRGGHQGGGYPEGSYPDGQYRDGSYPSTAYAGDAILGGRGPGPGRRPAGAPAAPPGSERQPGPAGPQTRPLLQGQALPAEPAPVAAPPPPVPRGPGLDQPVKPEAALALRKEPPAKPRTATPQEQLEEFAKDLRELRGQAGLGYPEMAELSHYTMKTLASAAGGLNLPTLPVTMAYVRACDGSVADWEDRWHRLADALKSAGDETGPTFAAKGQSGPGESRPDGADAGGRPPAGDRHDAADPVYGRRPEGRDDGQARQEQAGPPRPRPSQVSTPPSAPEQEPPPPSDQVYVITSAVPRRPRR